MRRERRTQPRQKPQTVSIPEATEAVKVPNQKKQRIINRLRLSMKCLDELYGKNRFDAIRINEIQFSLHDVEEILLEE